MEKQELQRLGFKVYAPHDDKDINDKENAKQDKLAERIVANDTLGMETSDVMIFDYLPHKGQFAKWGMHSTLKEQVRKILKFMFNVLTSERNRSYTRRTRQNGVQYQSICVWRNYGYY